MLNVNALMGEAARRARLDDFGAEDFKEPLERLVESVNRESVFSPFGAMAFPEVLIHSLVNRLEVEQWYQRHPEIDDEKITAPVFIVGLPRTGSTLLSYQLALDPGTRSLRLWESERPCPPPVADQDQHDPRIAEADARHDAFIAACPAIARMTPYDPAGPVECYELFYLSFQYMHYNMFTHCPTYTAWVEDAARDHGPAYRYHKRVLKLLQWRRPPRRWQLKMPSHSLMLDSLTQVYPDARLIMTHRDPAKVIPSTAHLNVAVRQQFNVDPRKKEFGGYIAGFWEGAMRRLLAYRARNEAQFFDIYHGDQLIDPIPSLRKLYAWLDWPLTSRDLGDVTNWRRENPKADNPHDPAEYGLNPASINRVFSFYTERFFPKCSPTPR
jgi:hypothetical protein